MGYLERGAWHTNEAISLGNSLGHGPSQTVAWGWWGLAQAIRRGPASLADEAEIEALIGELEKGIGVIDRYGPPHFRPNCQCVLAWVKVVTGNIQEGLAEIRSSIDIYRATGATLRLPIFQFMLAEIYLAIKDFDGAAKAVDDGLQIIDQEGDRTFWAELMRVRGEIALANPNGGNESVEMLFQQAIAVASNQGAKLSELRSRTRLADHLLGLGRRGEARDLLAQPYGWFTEGLNEFDLLTARQVLDRIS